MAILPRSQRCAQEVDAGGFLAFVDAVERSGIELHGLMALRHGHVVAEGLWAPYTADRPHLLYSVSKSFTSIAVGLAVEDGLLSVGDSLLMHLADFAPADVDERWRAVTLDDALRMATGHVDDPIYSVISWCSQHDDPEWLRALFTMPPERAPGTVFTYNNMATYALARIVQRATGRRLIDYLGSRVFEPLGIMERLWMTDVNGHDWGFSGLHLTTESLAACGQLWLQAGRWQDRQLVPAGWLRAATSALMRTDAAHRGDPTYTPRTDWATGCGYQFWQSRHGYRGDGAYGQFCLVLPEQDAVVALTSATERATRSFGDLSQPAVLAEAVSDVAKVYHVGPTLHPRERAMGIELIDAARAAGAGHFVFSSVLHAITTDLVQHEIKRDVEEHLLSSGLEFTILQPSNYMLPLKLRPVFERGVFELSWSLHRRQSLVDLDDVTDVAAMVLSDTDRHAGATYELAGPGPYTAHELGDIISAVLGRAIEVRQIDADTYLKAWVGDTDPAQVSHQLRVLRAITAHYSSHDFVGNPNVLNWLLQRPPADFETFVRRQYDAYREAGKWT